MPRDFRVRSLDTIEIENGIGFFNTFSDLMRASIGTGILALPYAFMCSGYISGVIGCVFLGWVTYYCVRLIYYNMLKMSRENDVSFNYGETFRLALEKGPNCTKKLAPYARTIIQVCIILFQLAIACVYYLYIAKNLKQFITYIADTNIPTWILLLAIFPMILGLNFIKNFKIITPFSHIGNAITVLVVIALIVYLLAYVPQTDTITPFGTFLRYPIFYGVGFYSFCTIGVFIKIIEKMKYPRDMIKCGGVLDISIIFLTIVYAIIGLIGYSRYGVETQGSITLNLDLNYWLTQSIKFLSALSVICAYAIHSFVLLDILINEMIFPKLAEDMPKWKYYLIDYSMRILLAILSLISSFIIPNLGIMTAIAGAAILTIIGIIIPAYIDFCRINDDKSYGPIGLWLILDIFFLVYGFIMFFVGVGQPLYEVVMDYMNDNIKNDWID